MTKAVIIDDERLAIKELQHYLKTYETIEVTGTFINPEKGIKYIEEHKPDLVFLDINMPGIMGINVAEKLLDVDSAIRVVFVTAYDEYALEAFRVYAFDYIMKPIDSKRLDKTLQRLISKNNSTEGPKKDARLHVRCFGGFEICWDGMEELKWRTSKTRELMAYLIHNRNCKLTKDSILCGLWPDQPPDKAIRQLYNGIYYIRKALLDYGIPSELISISPRYHVQLKDAVSDVAEFNQLLDSTQPDPRKMTALYKGDYMAGNDWDWAVPQQQSIRERYIQHMIEAVKVLLRDRKTADAEKYLKDLYRLDPFEERVSYLLVRTYIMKGEKNKAFGHYETYEALINRELGIKPEEDFQNLLKFL